MTTVNNATAAPATPAAAAAPVASASAGAGSAANEASDRFLTLLVTQLKNQDPLNPLDNAQITTQLAQLSTVTGINKLNDTVAAVAAQMSAGQYLQALPMVGHDVLVAGDKMALSDGKGQYAVAFAKAADHVTVKITDADGKLVRTIESSEAQPAGVATFDWDGKKDDGSACPDGTYSVAITATKAGVSVGADPLTVGHVSGVVPGNNSTLLQLGSLGTVDLAQVLQIN